MNIVWTSRAAIVTIGALFFATTAAAQAGRRQALELTLADAVQRAVERNPDLAIVRLDTEVEAARVGEARGAYAPVFSTVFGRSRNVTPPTNLFTGDTGVDVGGAHVAIPRWPQGRHIRCISGRASGSTPRHPSRTARCCQWPRTYRQPTARSPQSKV